IMCGYLKSNLGGTLTSALFLREREYYITAGNGLFAAVGLLVDARLVQADLTACGLHCQIFLGVDLEFVHTCKGKLDDPRIGSRGNDKVVFQLPLVAIEDQIDTRVDIPVLHPGIGRDVGVSLFSIVAAEVGTISVQFRCASVTGL